MQVISLEYLRDRGFSDVALFPDGALVEAEKLMEDNWESEKEPHRSIWKSSLLGTKALMLYNNGDIDKAKEDNLPIVWIDHHKSPTHLYLGP